MKRVDVPLQDGTMRVVQLGVLHLYLGRDFHLGVVVDGPSQKKIYCKMARLTLKDFCFALPAETKGLFGPGGKVQFLLKLTNASVHLYCEIQQCLVLPSFVLYQTHIEGTSDVGLLREAIQNLRGS